MKYEIPTIFFIFFLLTSYSCTTLPLPSCREKRRLTLCLDEKRRDTFQLLFLLFSSSLHCFNLYQTCPYQSFSTTFIINQYLIVLVISLDHKKERKHICKFWYSGVVSLSIDSSIYKSMEP